MRKIVVICFCALYCTAFSQVQVTIHQTCDLKELTVFYKDGSEGAQATKINDSTAVYSIPVEEPFYLYIIVDETTRYAERLWIDPSAHNREVTIDNCRNRMTRPDTIDIELADAPRVAEEEVLRKEHAGDDSTDRAIDKLKREYILQHPQTFLATWYLSHIMYRTNIDSLVRLRNLVGSFKPTYKTFKSINAYVDNFKFKNVPKAGDSFYEFEAKRYDGEPFDTRNISNKVIVLFFWYSGCGPCHQVMPALNALYNKYKVNGLDVISFSFDDKENDWRKACETFKPAGVSVSDLVGFNSPLMFHYGVSAFPFFVVFDKDKKISLITYGADEMPLVEDKVSELVGKK